MLLLKTKFSHHYLPLGAEIICSSKKRWTQYTYSNVIYPKNTVSNEEKKQSETYNKSFTKIKKCVHKRTMRYHYIPIKMT